MPMTQREAAKILRRHAPDGEFPAFISPSEAALLKKMGGAGKKTKSGLNSYFLSGITSALGLGGGQDERQQTSTSTSQLDPMTQKFKGEVLDKTRDVMDQQYEAYDPTQRFEGQSADTTQSFADVRGMQGRGQDAFKAAGQVGADVSKYSPEQVQQQSFLGGKGVGEYMSPHTQNVIGGMQDQAMRTMQKQRGALQAQHQMAGAGMGSRGALENAAMMGEVQRGLGQQVAGALEGSYAQAAGMKGQDMDRAQQAARYNQQAGLAGQDVNLRGAGMGIGAAQAGRGAGYEDVSMLGKSGAAQEGYGQRDKDFAYDQWGEKRDWDKNQAMFGANVLGGMPTGSTTTASMPQYKKKGGLGGALMGGAMGFLSSGGNPWLAGAGALGGSGLLES
jgi:hypothetical protein